MLKRNAAAKGHLIIIGGTKGIGRAFRNLVLKNYRCITVVARSRPIDLPADNVPFNFVSVDVRNTRALKNCLSQAVAEKGPITGLALFQRYRGQKDSWEGNLSVSLTATRAAILALQGKFSKEDNKSIVIISSVASRFVADEQDEGYHVAKAGLASLTRYYAFKLGLLGIRVNAVSPGTILKDESKDFFLANKERHELYRQIIPLRRMGTAVEVAKVVQFLLSDAASFITGQEITVDGGAGLHWQESLARQIKQV